MHSTLNIQNEQLVLLYLENLSCFMTSSIEARIRRLLVTLGIPSDSLPIRSTPSLDSYPQQLLDLKTQSEKQDVLQKFQNSSLGQYLTENTDLWKKIAEEKEDFSRRG